MPATRRLPPTMPATRTLASTMPATDADIHYISYQKAATHYDSHQNAGIHYASYQKPQATSRQIFQSAQCSDFWSREEAGRRMEDGGAGGRLEVGGRLDPRSREQLE
ncbi:hypothetical protein P7K49_012869, partial [Saguinus oedipus]